MDSSLFVAGLAIFLGIWLLCIYSLNPLGIGVGVAVGILAGALVAEGWLKLTKCKIPFIFGANA